MVIKTEINAFEFDVKNISFETQKCSLIFIEDLNPFHINLT